MTIEGHGRVPYRSSLGFECNCKCGFQSGEHSTQYAATEKYSEHIDAIEALVAVAAKVDAATDATLPSHTVLSDEAFDEIGERIANPRRPNAALLGLPARDDDQMWVPQPHLTSSPPTWPYTLARCIRKAAREEMRVQHVIARITSMRKLVHP